MRGIKKGTTGNRHNAWKESVGYSAIHKWISLVAGKPSFCEKCKITKAPIGFGTKRSYFQWANISGKYKRDIKDWKRLCYWCHVKYDAKYHGRKTGPKTYYNGK